MPANMAEVKCVIENLRMNKTIFTSAFIKIYIILYHTADDFQQVGALSLQAYRRTSCASKFSLCGGERGSRILDFLPISNQTRVSKNSSLEYICGALTYKVENKVAKNIQLTEVNCDDRFALFCEQPERQ
jgi:hypothetical protein